MNKPMALEKITSAKALVSPMPLADTNKIYAGVVMRKRSVCVPGQPTSDA